MASLPRLPLWLNRNYRQFKRLYHGKTAIFPTPDTPLDPAIAAAASNVNSITIASNPLDSEHANTTSTTTTTTTLATTTETATVNINAVQSSGDNGILIKTTTLEANTTVINETVSSTASNSSTSDQTLTIKTETSSATSTTVLIDHKSADDTKGNSNKPTDITDAEKMDIDASSADTKAPTIANSADANAADNEMDPADNNDDNNNSSSSSSSSTDDNATTDKKTPAIGGIKSRQLQRTNCLGCTRDYIVDDRSEVNVCFKKYRVVFVMNKNAVLYKVNSVPRARKMHPIVTKKMSQKFQKFVGKWEAKHISAEQEKRCMEWFMGHIPDSIPHIETVKVQVYDETKTPYRPFNRYKVKRTGSS